MILKFRQVGRYQLNWDVPVSVKPAEADILRHLKHRKGAVVSKGVDVEYRSGSGGDIRVGGRKVGEFEVVA